MPDSQPNPDRYYRASLGLKQAITGELSADYHSVLIDRIRENNNCLEIGSLRFRLAKEFGFCYGVDKAVDLAYEARRKFPDRRIFLTHEIIHNPRVNQRLRDMGILFLSGSLAETSIGFDNIETEDVVIIPAFGVSAEELALLKSKGCILVDTTCGSVIHVWKRVERYTREGFTSLIHGKYAHEETVATKSRALAHGGHYLVVRDLEEADLVCDVIRGEKPPESLDSLATKAASPGFDPRRDLQRIGVANQTTMLSSESLDIAERTRRALADRYGEDRLDDHYRAFDTICSATQNRQDAVLELIAEGLDLMIVVGGYNSSNTGHLCEIASHHCPAFHIDDASAILSATQIRHKLCDATETTITTHWMPQPPLTIGITAGASTPNRAIGETIQRLVEVQGIPLPGDLREQPVGQPA